MAMNTHERDIAMDAIELFMQHGFMEAFSNSNGTMWDWSQNCGLDGLQYTDGATKCVFFWDELTDWVIKCRLPSEKLDYCSREYDNYRAAVEQGFEYYFAAVEYLCEVNGITFYAQSRVECDEDVDSCLCEKLMCSYEESGTPYNEDLVWDEIEAMDSYERMILLYNNTLLANFVSARRINDLHCGNFGTAGDHYVMIDFSGFGSAVWSR